MLPGNPKRTARLCIFTPTYNRAYTLERLFESLSCQTSKDFLWFVVDDGSTDETQQMLERFRSSETISIVSVKTENGGKQRAHNLAVEMCESELFLCVDSDDYLVPTAVEELLATWDDVGVDGEYAGILFLKGFSNEKLLSTPLPVGITSCTTIDLYEKHRFSGDTGLLYRTDLLKRYPFAVAPGEKFIGEGYVYRQIDQEHPLFLLDRILYVAEYLPDGYSKNIRKVTKENPVGYLTLKKQSVLYDNTLFSKYRDTALYLVGCMLAKRKRSIVEAPSTFLALLAYPAALVLRYTAFR